MHSSSLSLLEQDELFISNSEYMYITIFFTSAQIYHASLAHKVTVVKEQNQQNMNFILKLKHNEYCHTNHTNGVN